MLSAFIVTSAMFTAALGVATDTVSTDIPFPVVASSATQVRVDIGVDRTRAQAIRRAVVLTPTGTVPATLVRTRRVCEYLCGPDDGRECHFEAVLKPSRPVRGAIAVFPAGVAITHVAPLTMGRGQLMGSEQTWIDAKPIPDPGGNDKSRWVRLSDGVVHFVSESSGGDAYEPPILLNTCTRYAIAPLTMVKCEFGEMLYEGYQGIVGSVPDYGHSSVRPLARFQFADKDAMLIRLGVKAYMTVALLVKEAGQWRLTFWSADYATIC